MQLKTGEKHLHSYQQSKKKLRPILSRASRIQKKYHITGATRYTLSSSPDSPATHPLGQAARYNLSSSPDSPPSQAGRADLLASPLDSPSRAGAAAAAAVVVRANPLYDMMEEECGWWRQDEGAWRVRALGQRAPLDSTPHAYMYSR